MLRARPTSWFELLTSRDQFALAMQTLAATGAAQLEAKALGGSQPVLPRLDGFFAAFRALESTYGAYWPAARGHAGLVLEDPIAMLDETQTRLNDWAALADPTIQNLRTCEARLGELAMIARLVEAVPADTPLARLSEAQSRLLDHAIFFLPETEDPLPDVEGVLFERFAADGGDFVIAIADQPEMVEIAALMATRRATPVPLPDFLSADPEAHRDQVRDKIAETQAACARHRATLDELAAETGLAGLLSRVAVLEWLQQNAGDITATKHMMRVTGWTGSPDGAALRDALDAAGVDFVLTMGDDAPDNAPMVLDNPSWLRAFEFFPRLLGVPSAGDIDPSPVTALIAPVLFGFMFGDVGQGGVLLVAGILLRKRVPLLGLLIPGGISAMIFGVLFGSVFSLEGVIAPLWLHPLNEPITVLAVALVLGAVLLLVGIALDFTQAAWHGQAMRWVGQSGGLLVAFLAILGAWFDARLAWGVGLGVAMTLAGARDTEGWTLAAAGKAVAEFVESMMRLLVATVSFARVGAFALAHAGLSAAIAGVAESFSGVGFWITLAFGNALILGLEGLVTGIQTTRLILFEFFIRFYRAEGREFHPLAAPRPQTTKGTQS